MQDTDLESIVSEDFKKSNISYDSSEVETNYWY